MPDADNTATNAPAVIEAKQPTRLDVIQAWHQRIGEQLSRTVSDDDPSCERLNLESVTVYDVVTRTVPSWMRLELHWCAAGHGHVEATILGDYVRPIDPDPVITTTEEPAQPKCETAQGVCIPLSACGFTLPVCLGRYVLDRGTHPEAPAHGTATVHGQELPPHTQPIGEFSLVA